jgi:hypothetical protein
MSKEAGAPEFIGMAIAEVIGWAFCMAMLAGAYLIGFYLADHFGGAEHRDAFGILSALVLIWLYEHRLAEERWSRFLQRYDS